MMPSVSSVPNYLPSTAPTMERKPQVVVEIDRLDASIDRLRQRMNAFRSRLDPVLRPENQKVPGQSTPTGASEPLAPVADMIRARAGAVDDIADLMDYFLVRLEI